MVEHSEADAARAPGKKPIEHIHHCPLCDPFKKVVRENVNRIKQQMWRIPYDGCPLSREETTKLRHCILDAVINIHNLFSAGDVRMIQNMTEEEFSEHANPRYLHFPSPFMESSDESGAPLFPAFTVIQGGKSEREDENCSIRGVEGGDVKMGGISTKS